MLTFQLNTAEKHDYTENVPLNIDFISNSVFILLKANCKKNYETRVEIDEQFWFRESIEFASTPNMYSLFFLSPGVNYRFGPPQDLSFHCLGVSCHSPHHTHRQRVELSTTVGFVDVTRPGIERYAEFPVLEAKFPHDFFYPFMTADLSDQAAEPEISRAANSNKVTLFFLSGGCLIAFWTSNTLLMRWEEK